MPADKIVRTVYVGEASSLLRAHAQIEASAASAASKVASSAAAQDAAMQRSARATSAMAKASGLAALGLGAALVGVVQTSAKFETQMSEVNAALRPTSEELGRLREAAIGMSKGTIYSATQAASAITELGKAGVSTADITGGALKGALDLAAAGALSVSEAAETAAAAMTQFGLSGKDVPHIADLLAAGAGKAQGSVHDLGMALNQAGLVANQVGLTIDETTTALTAMASAGLTGSDAGTALKSMLQRLTPQSKEAARQMKELGISAYDAQGNFIGLEAFAGNLHDAMKDLTPQQRNAALAIMFGSDAVRAANVIYAQGADGIRRWAGEVNDAGYAAQTAAKMNDNLTGDIKKLSAAFETAAIKSGSGLNSGLRTLVQTATNLVNALSEIPGPVLVAGTGLATLAALGPKLNAFGTAASDGIGKFVASMRNLPEQVRSQNGLRDTTTSLAGVGEAASHASGRITVAGTAMRTAFSGIKSAAGGLLNALGGPWGLGLAAAGAAVAVWANEQAQARQRVASLTEAIREQGAVIGEASGKMLATSLTEKMGLLGDSYFEEAQKLGISARQLVDAIQQGGAALDELKKKASDEAWRRFSTGEDLTALDRWGGLEEKINSARREIDQAATDAKNLDDAMAGAADTAGAAGAKLAHFGAAASAAADEMSSIGSGVMSLESYVSSLLSMGAESELASRRISILGDQVTVLEAEAKGGKNAVDALLDAILALGAGGRDVASSHRALNAAIREATSSVTDYKKALKTHDSTKIAEANDKVAASLESIATTALQSAVALIKHKGDLTGALAEYDNARAKVISLRMAMGDSADAANAYANEIMETREQLVQLAAGAEKASHKKVAILTSAPGAKETTAAIEGVTYRAEVANGKKVWIDTRTNAPVTDKEVLTLLNDAKDKNIRISTSTNAPQTAGALGALAAQANQLDGKVVDISVKVHGAGAVGLALSARGSARQALKAAGGVHEFAQGGFDRDGKYVPRVSQFGGSSRNIVWALPGGRQALWNEPHLPWEAYISGDPSIRARSLAIWAETGKRLGAFARGRLQRFAAGGLASVTAQSSLQEWAALVHPEKGRSFDALAAAADAASAAMRSAASAAQAAAVRAQELAAQVAALKATQAAQDRAIKKQIADLEARKAKLRSGGVTAAEKKLIAEIESQIAALRAKAKQLDASQSAALSALAAREKAAREAAASAASKEKEAAKAAQEAQQEAAQKAKEILEEQERQAKEAAAEAKRVADELAARQKAYADALRSAADKFRDQYGMAGDATDWLERMRQGAADLTQFQQRIEKLKAGGLSGELLQQIVAAGAGRGTDMADSILAGGKSQIDALNAASRSLDAAAMTLSRGTTDGSQWGFDNPMPVRIENPGWSMPAPVQPTFSPNIVVQIGGDQFDARIARVADGRLVAAVSAARSTR